MKINIIIDNKKSWYWPHGERLCQELEKRGHQCKILADANEVNQSDITFFLSCEKYVSKEGRAKSKYNIVIHASDLPSGKGMSPTTWQILEGKDEIPVTLFEVADKFDDGDYYIKDSFRLDGTELVGEWQDKLGETIEKMATEFVSDIKNMKGKKQSGKESVYRRREPDDSELDLDKPLKDQFNLLRVVDNEKYPAFFRHRGHKYILKIFKEK